MKRPWYLILLDRIEQKARCQYSTQIFVELCDDLRSSEMTEAERGTILARIDRMLTELPNPEEQVAKDHLGKLRQEFALA